MVSSGSSSGEQIGQATKNFPSPEDVLNIHMNSDVDASLFAQHHTLGSTGNQASPGDHKHDGASSNLLFDPNSDIATGDISTLAGLHTSMRAVLNALKKIGLSDTTTN